MTVSLQRPADTPPSSASENFKATAAAGITVVLWASAFVAIRDVGHTLSPAPMALVRLTVATVTLTVVMLVVNRGTLPIAVPRRSAGLLVAYGVLWLAGYTVALNAAERHVDAGTAALLVNIAPLLIAFGAGMLLGEGYPRPLILGSVIAFGGVTVIGLGAEGDRDTVGMLLCVLAALLYAAGVLIQKIILRRVDGLTTTWLGCAIGTIVLLPWANQLIQELQSASAGAIFGAVYLGVFPTAIGFTTWAYALRRMDAGRLSATTYAVPAVSVLLSWMLLSEVPTSYGLIGGTICLVGVAVSRRKDLRLRPRRHSPPERVGPTSAG